jgi:hypothetical protein
MNFSSLSVLVPPLFINVLTYKKIHIKKITTLLWKRIQQDTHTRNREMNPPNKKMVPTMRKRNRGASTKSLKADISQMPTEHTPLNTSPKGTIPVEQQNGFRKKIQTSLFVSNTHTFDFAHG